jgi:hydrogenase expression/formation protein HypC
MRIVEVNGDEAKVELGRVTRTISLALLESAAPGEYVLIHAGFAIGKMDEREAKLTLDALAECGLDGDGEALADDGYTASGA